MIETRARVVAVEPGFAWIEATRQSACGHCSESAGCGVSALGELFGQRRMRLRLPDPLDLRAGEAVLIGLPERQLLGAAVRAYLLPLLLMLGAALCVAPLGSAMQAGAGLAGLAIGLWLAALRTRIARGGPVQPVILGRTNNIVRMIDITGDNHE